MFSIRKSSALIVSGLLLLQMFGTATAATPTATPGAAAPTGAPKLVKFTPSADLLAQLAQARAERLAADALKARQQQQLKRSGTGFVPGDGAPSVSPMYKDDETVRVIVTLNGDSAAQKVAASGKQIQSVAAAFVQDAAQSTVAARDSVMSAAGSAGVSLTVRHTYGVALNGFSAEMRYGDLAKLQKVHGVKRVDVARVYQPTDNFSTQTVGASQLWDRNPAVDGIGQVIAIIDTGVDYRHPELGAQTDLDPNGKVIGGWNFADNSSQVLDFSGSGHGTHVAGIAAATGDGPQHIKGMAPKAKILAQKVFSNDGENKSAYTDDLVAAINDAIDPNSAHHPGVVAHVINMSLGSVSGFADATDPEQQAVAAAANAGAVVAISAGNSSYNTSAISNPYYWNQDIAAAGSPGTAPEAITVASSQNAMVTIAGRGLVAKIDGAAYSGGHYTVYLESSSKFGAFQTIAGASLPLVIPSGDEKGCSAADWQGVNLTGKIALIKLGTCTFQIQTDNAARVGAGAVVIFNQNPDPDITSMAVDAATIPAVMVMNSYGKDLQAALKADKQVKVAFNGQEQRLQLPDPKGDTMSSFSSWGTTPELGFKPDLTAPGGNIYSSIPNGQYEIMNGTSMAAPHVAGAAALVKQAHPDFTSAEVKAALMNTALVLKPSATAKPYSPRQQGAGRIQVGKAIDTNVVVTSGDKHTPGLMLGAVASHSVTPFTLTVTNRGAAAASFDLSGAVYRPSFDSSGKFNTLGSTALTGAAVTFAGVSSVSVPAGTSVTVHGALDLANATDPATAMFGYFAEGFITLTSKTDGQPDLTVPYMSYVGEWIGGHAQPIIDPMADDNLSYNETTGVYVPNPHYDSADPNSQKWIGLGYDLSGNFHANNMAINNKAFGPQGANVGLTLLRNAQILQIDVIDAAGKLVDRIGSEQAMRNLAASLSYLGDYWHWDGMKYDRTSGSRVAVAEGQYQVRVRALSPGGNADRDADWQTYMMPVKVDTTAPGMSVIASGYPNIPGPLTFRWVGAADNAGGSGLYGIVPIMDGKLLTENWTQPTASGSVIVDVPPGNHLGVGVCAVDNADNPNCYQFGPFNANAIAAVGAVDLQSNTPTVSLTYKIVDTVGQVTYQEGAATEVKAGTTGTINLNFAKDGKYTVVVRAYSDEAATTLVGSLTYTIDVDMTPPVLTITKPDIRKAYSSTSIDVAGSVTEAHPAALSGVQYSLDPVLDTTQNWWTDVAIGTDNTFSFTAVFDGNGRHNLNFRTQDAFGNHGELARVVVIGVDGPAITTALDPLMNPIPGNIDVRVSHPGDFRLTGATFDAAHNYSFKIDGMAQYSTDVLDPSVPRNWTYDVTDIGGADQAIVTLKAHDAADLTLTRTITFTSAGPSLVQATAPAVTKDPTVLVTGTVDAAVTLVLVNGMAAPLTGTGFMAPVTLTDGKNAIEVLARTNSDTLVGLDLLTVIRDTVAPVIQITDPPNGAFINGPYTLKGTVTDPNLDTVTVEGSPVPANARGEFSFDWSPMARPDGQATIVVAATDKAGNHATATAAFNLDQTPPALTVSVPSGVLTGTIKVAGTVTDVNFESVTVNGVAATPDKDGKFTADLTFSDGDNQTITVSATDKAKNRTNWNGTVTIDNTAPVVTITSPTEAGYLASGTVTVAGTVTDAHLTTATVDGQPVTVTNGSFSASLTRADGHYSVDVVATDAAGHTTTKAVTFSVVTAKPAITITNLHDADLVGRTVTVSGDVIQTNLVKLTVNGTEVTVTGGQFSAPVTYTSDGAQTITVYAIDKAGNTDQKTVSVTVDGTNPQLTITSPTNGAYLSSGSVTLTGTASDAHLATVTVDGQPVTVTGGNFSTTLSRIDGTHSVDVVATDAAGNTTTKTVSFTVITTMPTVTITSHHDGDVVGRTVTVSGDVVQANLAQLTVNGTPVEWTGGKFSHTVTFETDGQHTVTVAATDTAGHKDQKILTVIADGTKPVITITSPADGSVIVNPVTVTGTVTDAHQVSVTVNGTAATVNPNGAFTASVTMTDGRLKVIATDAAGNSTEKTITPELSTVLKSLTLAPEGTWSPSAGPLKITYELAAAGKVTLAVYQANTLKTTLINNTSKPQGINTFAWNGKIGSTVVDGTYEIRFTAGPASLSKQITIDTLAPRLTLGTVAHTTSQESVTIEGIADGAQTVDISVSGPTTVAGKTGVAVAGGGAFGATIDLKDRNGRSASKGTYTFTVTAKDALGNKATATVKITLDNVKPGKPTVTAPAYAKTKDPIKLTVRTGEPGTLTITSDSELSETFAIKSTSSTAILLDVSSLSDGKHTFTASFVDTLGNVATGSTTFSITIDRITPTLEISPDSLNQGARGKTYHLLGTVRDAGSGIASVRVNGSSVTLNRVPNDATAFTFDFRRTLSGTVGFQNKFAIVVTDKAGNVWTELFVVTSN